ncbi:hypothetical protein LOTGIDRAFT_176304, partial [Lottia gigantea]
MSSYSKLCLSVKVLDRVCKMPGSGVTEMDNTSLHSLDPRKQELLEARFLGTGSRFQPLNNSSTSQPMYDNSSNLSAGSVDREDAVSEGQLGTPDKCRTPTERKRKRKNAQDAGEFGSASKTGRAETNGKKINEYFKQTNQSPSRTIIPASGAKSPSPQALSHGYLAASPQNSSHSSHSEVLSFPARPIYCSSKGVQTDMTGNQMKALESRSVSDIEQKDSRIDDLVRQNDEIRRQLTAQQKLLEKHKENLQKCLEVNKSLLIEKSELVKKTTRQKCMENRLRLGQFVTQRQGAQFVENWVDGWAFTDLM